MGASETRCPRTVSDVLMLCVSNLPVICLCHKYVCGAGNIVVICQWCWWYVGDVSVMCQCYVSDTCMSVMFCNVSFMLVMSVMVIYQYVSVLCQWCVIDVWVMQQWCVSVVIDMSVMHQWCVSDMSVMCQWCISDASVMCQLSQWYVSVMWTMCLMCQQCVSDMSVFISVIYQCCVSVVLALRQLCFSGVSAMCQW